MQIPIYYFGGMYSTRDESRWKQIWRLAWTTALGTGHYIADDGRSAGGWTSAGIAAHRLAALCGHRPDRCEAHPSRRPGTSSTERFELAANHPRRQQLITGSSAVHWLLYMAYNKIAFGTFMPVSGQIKAWWGSLQGSAYGNPIANLAGLLGLEREEGLNAWGPVIYLVHDLKDWLGTNLWLVIGFMLIAVLLILFTRPKRSARAAVSMGLPLLLTGSLLQLCYYNGQGYAGAKDWYWVSQMLFFPLLGALCFDLILRPVRRLKWGQTLEWGIAAAAVHRILCPSLWVCGGQPHALGRGARRPGLHGCGAIP